MTLSKFCGSVGSTEEILLAIRIGVLWIPDHNPGFFTISK